MSSIEVLSSDDEHESVEAITASIAALGDSNSTTAAAVQSSTITDIAYVKILSHAFKHADRAIIGLLLAQGAQTESNSSSNIHVDIHDVLPLFHSHSHTLASAIEIALMQSDVYCRTHNLRVVGVYCASSNVDHRVSQSLHIALPIANKLLESNSGSVIAVIDHNQIFDSIINQQTAAASSNSRPSSRTLVVFRHQQKQGWQQSAPSQQLQVATTAARLLQKALSDDPITAQPFFFHLNDLDDHLSNVSKDWFNTEFKAILK